MPIGLSPLEIVGKLDGGSILREKYEATVVPGGFFEMPEHFRVGLGGKTEMLVAGLERLGAALDELR